VAAWNTWRELIAEKYATLNALERAVGERKK
jgi:hypothetical protein